MEKDNYSLNRFVEKHKLTFEDACELINYMRKMTESNNDKDSCYLVVDVIPEKWRSMHIIL